MPPKQVSFSASYVGFQHPALVSLQSSTNGTRRRARCDRSRTILHNDKSFLFAVQVQSSSTRPLGIALYDAFGGVPAKDV